MSCELLRFYSRKVLLINGAATVLVVALRQLIARASGKEVELMFY